MIRLPAHQVESLTMDEWGNLDVVSNYRMPYMKNIMKTLEEGAVLGQDKIRYQVDEIIAPGRIEITRDGAYEFVFDDDAEATAFLIKWG